MSMLFQTDIKRGAIFSDCRTWRYVLWRVWDESLPMLMWIGLNPSTADETKDDPTIRRCMGFARSWGYGGIYMLNLFAFRATDPAEMKLAVDPIGDDNYSHLAEFHERSGRTMAAWGVHGSYEQQDACVSRLRRIGPHAKTQYLGDDLWCLGCTKDGSPKHPLYVPATAKFQRFIPRF